MANLPATLAVDWGGRTLKRLGGYPIPYTGAGTLSLTGTASSTGWFLEQIADENNVTRWMLTLSGTAGTAPPVAVSGAANGATFTGTIGDGVDSCALTITIEADAYDVRPKWSDTTTGTTSTETRWTLVNTALRVQLGNRIRLRPGTYGLIQGQPTTTQRVRFLTPQGTWTGSNYVIISPRVAYDAVWHRASFDNASATSGNAYFSFEDIQFTSALLVAGEDPDTRSMFGTANAIHNMRWTGCRFWAPSQSQGVPPAGTGRDMSVALAIFGDNLIVDGNDFQDVWSVVVNGGSISRGLTITDNNGRRIWNDCIKTGAYEIAVTGNFFTDKLHPDPADGGASGTQGAHADYFQHTGWTDGVSRTFGTIANNIFVRGLGRAGTGGNGAWADGQGLFIQDSNNGSRLLGAVIENNFIIQTPTNGISLRNAVDPLIRNNTVLLDPTVGDTCNPNTGTGNFSPVSPKLGLDSGASGAGASGGTVTGNVSIGALTQQNVSPAATQTNAFTLSPTAPSGSTSYADNYDAPAWGADLATAADVKAAFKPKVGGPIALALAGPFDNSGNFRTYTDATQTTLTGPTGGIELVASTDFTVGANGTITGTVTVTPDDGGAGGVFTPSTVQISAASPTATFTYTPPLGPTTRIVSTTNNGGLSDPASISYAVTAQPVTTVTLSAPSTLYLNIPDVITASLDGDAASQVVVTLDAVAGLTFGGTIVIAAGDSTGATSVVGTTLGAKTITGSDNAGLIGPDPIGLTVSDPPPVTATVGQLFRLGIRVG